MVSKSISVTFFRVTLTVPIPLLMPAKTIINPVMMHSQNKIGNPSSICAVEAIAHRSAPNLIVFAITNSETEKY